MLKPLVTIISVMAVINLLAMLLSVGWLWQSDRLNADRIDVIRELFAETTTAEQQRLDEEQAEADATQARTEAEAIANRLPMTAEAQLAHMQVASELDQLNIQHMKGDAEVLQRALDNKLRELEREREALSEKVQAFEEMVTRTREIQESEQFEKTLAIYQGLEPKEVKSIWKTMIGRGEIDVVVSFLNAMQTRKATAVISEIQKDDPTLAEQLLERLRTHGFAVASPEDVP
ncbi:MAG: hypothetical protein KAS72_01050 [Phycisphaerales bacterium]|nr:hypothetical protein [Phycisphaerales bacterium]